MWIKRITTIHKNIILYHDVTKINALFFLEYSNILQTYPQLSYFIVILLNFPFAYKKLFLYTLYFKSNILMRAGLNRKDGYTRKDLSDKMTFVDRERNYYYHPENLKRIYFLIQNVKG